MTRKTNKELIEEIRKTLKDSWGRTTILTDEEIINLALENNLHSLNQEQGRIKSR